MMKMLMLMLIVLIMMNFMIVIDTPTSDINHKLKE